MYNAQLAPYTVHCTVYNVHCTRLTVNLMIASFIRPMKYWIFTTYLLSKDINISVIKKRQQYNSRTRCNVVYISPYVVVMMRYHTYVIWSREEMTSWICDVCNIQNITYVIHLYSVQYTLYTVQCTMYNVQCTMYTAHCTLYTIPCTLYTVHYVLYNVQCHCI